MLNLPFLDRREIKLKRAINYREWAEGASQLDKVTGKDEWRNQDESALYDYTAIRIRFNKLKKYRRAKNYEALLFTLNEGIHGNMGQMGNHRLYGNAKLGTKKLIEAYIDEVVLSLDVIAKTTSKKISVDEKNDFLNRASHCYGHSALMLSGGGALGFFHVGVIKTLFEQNILPKVISGASAGSIMAAIVGTNTPEKLADYFEPENLLIYARKEASIIRHIWGGGYKKIDVETLNQFLDTTIPDLTFEEAYNLTGRKINITISPSERHQSSRLLNAIASPNVLIRSAVRASTAVPGVFDPVTLMARNKDGEKQRYLPSRKWVDGSFSDDLPAKRLARLYGVNHYIVSLTNPMVIPFTVDPTAGNEFTRMIGKVSKTLLREYAVIGQKMSHRFLKFSPQVESMASMFYSILAQNYTGNINIIYRAPKINYRRIMTCLTHEEMLQMIQDGEAATWPKVTSIRTSTKIGVKLEELLNACK